MDNIKRLKKGETLFREGDVTQSIFIVQSGKIGLMVDRGGKKMEITQLGISQILGEQGLFVTPRQPYSAEALQETKVMEVPLEALKAQYNQCPTGMKLIVKSLVEETKASRQSLKSLKMETDKSPCPQIAIPRVFSLLNLVGRHTGKVHAENKREISIDWGVLKLYTARLFAESAQRMRSLADLLLKLQHADLQFSKNEEGEEELSKIVVKDIQFIEDFAEFYQYNLYKGQRAEVIYVDTLALKVAKALCSLSKDRPVDHKGATVLDYNVLMDEMKKVFHLELKNTHLDILEKKGLYVNRRSHDNGNITLAFDAVEFKKTVSYWNVIHEIDQWNEKGFVDLNPPEEASQSQSGMTCVQCHGHIEKIHKFCPHCGHKQGASAA